ncbi:unnamed protein product [Cylicocyclus nassatus]|uniref:Uncharacterized protein n=1 Tax=Cylicocyclus nassatus TaxID=53992 RepID=A0AA36DT78_CYLNA|nr:unnamed protein product [Cylicocyclus nassatus]
MTEFRRLACCVTRPWNSRSCSVLNKSFVNTRSVIRDDELLEMDSPQIREPLLNMTHDPIVNSVSAQAWSRQELTRLRPTGNSAKIIKEDQVDFVDADIEMGAVKKKSAAFQSFLQIHSLWSLRVFYAFSIEKPNLLLAFQPS